MTGLELVKNYTKEQHLEVLYKGEIKDFLILKNLKYAYDGKWNDKDYPYVPVTHLLDSYYCLPERPDMAFTFLWKAINSIYNKNYLIVAGKGGSIGGVRIDGGEGDSKKLYLMIESVTNRLNDTVVYKGNTFSLMNLIDLYVEKMPIKTLRFVANYVLKGLAIDNKLNYGGLHGRLMKTHLSSQYSTFKSTFQDLLSIIGDTYGKSYLDISFLKSNIHNSQIDVDTFDQDKSRRLAHSLATKFKELLVKKEATFKDIKDIKEEEKDKYTFKLNDDGMYLKFVYNCILYAMRNTSFHGNVASRFNSKTFDKEAIESSTYVYLLGHLFLTLCLYVNGELSAQELAINIENLNLI
ncbi:hypothetical protein [Bacillus thuringiensis]|uniref:hypothetical protein n=1 Tax=Bacillus thuringiensis TaxID=1428 RepID=UPI000BF5C1BF|nr:hypothetical protein [Bacillus thuringiensis]PFV45215.1 hypothetical protein COL14_26370 [Bacillus thuringiensis]